MARLWVNSLRKYILFMSAIHSLPTTHSQSESRMANDGNDESEGPRIVEIGSSETASDSADSESPKTSAKVCGEHMDGCIDGK